MVQIANLRLEVVQHTECIRETGQFIGNCIFPLCATLIIFCSCSKSATLLFAHFDKETNSIKRKENIIPRSQLLNGMGGK